MLTSHIVSILGTGRGKERSSLRTPGVDTGTLNSDSDLPGLQRRNVCCSPRLQDHRQGKKTWPRSAGSGLVPVHRDSPRMCWDMHQELEAEGGAGWPWRRWGPGSPPSLHSLGSVCVCFLTTLMYYLFQIE